MKFSRVAALALGLSAVCFRAAAQDTPRELGGAPTAPAPAPRPAAPAPRQLATTPAVADSARPAPVAPTPSAIQPGRVYDGPPGSSYSGSSRSTRYQVGLKSGTVYNVYEVDVKSPLFGRSYLLLDGQKRLDLSEVGFYENETGHYVRTALPGSNRDATLRREKTGRISLYATYSTSYSPGYGGYGGFGGYGGGGYPYGGGGYRTTKTEYFSKDNGPIQDLTFRNLAAATGDNAGAQELLAKARQYRTGIILSYVAAAGFAVAGLAQSSQANANGISPLFYLAIPALVVPLVLQGKQAAAQRQAISLYNNGR
ncbi:MAG: hypothetical protein ACRYFX_11245 [Janthinobacterium lividum]